MISPRSIERDEVCSRGTKPVLTFEKSPDLFEGAAILRVELDDQRSVFVPVPSAVCLGRAFCDTGFSVGRG